MILFSLSWVWSPMLVALIVSIAYLVWFVGKPVYSQYLQLIRLENDVGPTEKHWFFGHVKTYPLSQEGLTRGLRLFATHPTMFHYWLGPFIASLVVYHSDTAVPILSSGAPKSEMAYRFIRPWVGDGLLTSKGKKWQRNRHLLTPAFHFNILKGYVKVVNETSKTMLDKWKDHIDCAIDVTDDVSLMTLDTMLKCAMSSDTNCQHARNGHPYIRAVKNIEKIVTKRVVTLYMYPDFVFWRTSLGKQLKQELYVVHSHAEQIIAERRESLKDHLCGGSNDVPQDSQDFRCSNRKLLDFLDILLQTKDEDGKGLTDSEIRDEVDTFLFEGHDTTSSGISWALYNIAKHPKMQETCRKEVKEVLGGKHIVSWEDLPKFTYLTMFIKESLRLYPPVFAVERQLEESITLKSDLNKQTETVVPKQSTCTLNLFLHHRNELMWEKPLEFNPERFTKENIAKRSPHAYLPFSAGSRNCIGQNFAMNEMKIALAKTLQRYRLYLDEETPEPVMEPRLILQSKDGIHIKLERLM